MQHVQRSVNHAVSAAAHAEVTQEVPIGKVRLGPEGRV